MDGIIDLPQSGLARLSYISTSIKTLQRHEVAALVETFQKRNAASEITGCLLVEGKCFSQILEGPAPTLRALLARLESDPRHYNLIVIEARPVTQRDFEGWSMKWGFRDDVADEVVCAA